MTAIETLAEFVTTAEVPDDARNVARDAVQDTLGVMLAGTAEPAAAIVQRVTRAEGGAGRASVIGTRIATSATWAALANGTAAHALDFDDMCWVTLAHPSAPLVAAALATAETMDASGAALLDAYVVGFEVEAVLGAVMNPSHYEQGWHGTSTIGTIGAAAAAARVFGLDSEGMGRALSIAASEASGLKENFGTMVKPLQGGLAARNGVLAALLARESFTASPSAIDGPQGFLVAMQSQGHDLAEATGHLGERWEIVDGGITVKLYPSCAATHPTIDALIDLRREHDLDADTIASVDVSVDSVTPTVLIYDRPATGLEGKFSLHYCAAAALAFGRVEIDTFAPEAMHSPTVKRLVPLVAMRVDETLGREAPPLTEARVCVRLVDGRVLERVATGARGYPERPASRSERDAKFTSCARRAVSGEAAADALAVLHELGAARSVRSLVASLATDSVAQPV